MRGGEADGVGGDDRNRRNATGIFCGARRHADNQPERREAISKLLAAPSQALESWSG